MVGNKNNVINKARVEKNDEFYTRYEDIENELKNYINHFEGKIIYCNADNPKYSNFYKYFKDNFENFSLKELIATYYESGGKVYATLYDGANEERVELIEDGDFRSNECISLIKKSDIVITNPPFSLFKDLIKLLNELNKSFIIVGHQNAITNPYMFNMIKNNRVWLGYGFKGSAAHFINKNYENYAIAKDKIDGHIRVSGVTWFTNLKIDKKIPSLNLSKTYNEIDYPKYDGYDCINIDKTKDIPIDYNGYMGVPVSYFNKHNHKAYEICGLDDHRVGYPKVAKPNSINGINKFRRIIIKKIDKG